MFPALIMAIHNFGLRAALVIACSVLGAVAAEFFIQKFLLNKPSGIADGSAVVTGILLAFCVPVAIPLWVAFTGGFVAIALGKQAYGGLGQNIFNPAHVARAVLLASWPVYMTTWLKPGMGMVVSTADAVTTATPLGLLKETAKNTELMNQITASGGTLVSYVLDTLKISFSDLFLGINFSGSLGETSKLALLIGGLYLLIRGHIIWHAPVAMLFTVFAGAFIAGGSLQYAMFHLLTGGLIIGAIFMITDMVTSPMTSRGLLLFGFGCGALTLLIRLKGGYPEGVCYSILIMNAFVPLIDKFFVPKRFGTGLETRQ
jgi:electron transport complex protein RnfD